MKNDIFENVFALKQAIIHHPTVLELDRVEQEMNQSNEVKQLSDAFRLVQEKYSELLHYYPATSKEAESCQRDLFEAKQRLDMHPLVHQYYHLYRQVRNIYQMVQEALFTPFTSHVCGGDF